MNSKRPAVANGRFVLLVAFGFAQLFLSGCAVNPKPGPAAHATRASDAREIAYLDAWNHAFRASARACADLMNTSEAPNQVQSRRRNVAWKKQLARVAAECDRAGYEMEHLAPAPQEMRAFDANQRRAGSRLRAFAAGMGRFNDTGDKRVGNPAMREFDRFTTLEVTSIKELERVRPDLLELFEQRFARSWAKGNSQ